MIKVGVLGAAGRMGSVVCAAVASDAELDLVAAVDPVAAGDPVAAERAWQAAGTLWQAARGPDPLELSAGREALVEQGAEVVVDFTHPSQAESNVMFCIENGIHTVVGTTGVGPDAIARIRAATDGGAVNVLIAPNFAIGAVLMMHFAKLAAPYFERAEVIELHHDGKADAPSGTALRTAELMNEARAEGWPDRGESEESIPGVRGGADAGIRIHSVRLPGLVAHQEVILGTLGQTLAIRHDSSDRTSFMPGVLLAVKEVGGKRGLTIGLEAVLGL